MSDFASEDLGSNPKPATKKGVILQKYIFRLCPLIVIVAVLLLSLSPMTVSAAGTDFDYTDYIVTDSYADGMNTLLIRIPMQDFAKPFWSIYELREGASSYKYIVGAEGAAMYLSVKTFAEDYLNPLMIDYFAFKGGDYLSLKDIPNGSKLKLEYTITDYKGPYPDFRCRWVLNYYDKDHQLITTVNTELQDATFEVNQTEITLNKPEGAMYLTCSVRWYNVSLEYSGRYLDLTCSAFVFELSIDAMLREQQQTGRTNELLEDIGDALNETIPGADDSINNSNQSQDKLDQMGDAMANVPKPEVNDVNLSIDNYVSVQTTASINDFFSAFWNSQFFLTMCLLLLTIGTCSYILFGKR